MVGERIALEVKWKTETKQERAGAIHVYTTEFYSEIVQNLFHLLHFTIQSPSPMRDAALVSYSSPRTASILSIKLWDILDPQQEYREQCWRSVRLADLQESMCDFPAIGGRHLCLLTSACPATHIIVRCSPSERLHLPLQASWLDLDALIWVVVFRRSAISTLVCQRVRVNLHLLNLDSLLRPVLFVYGHGLHFVQRLPALQYPAKGSILPIKMRSGS